MELKMHNKYYLLLVFWVGIIATVAYRLIVVLNHYSSLWVEIAWHIGTIGFIWYFIHRYRTQNYHSRLVKELKLEEKICQNQLSGDDCQVLLYLLKRLNVSKAKWNSMLIFILSAVALGYAVISNLMKLAND